MRSFRSSAVSKKKVRSPSKTKSRPFRDRVAVNHKHQTSKCQKNLRSMTMAQIAYLAFCPWSFLWVLDVWPFAFPEYGFRETHLFRPAACRCGDSRTSGPIPDGIRIGGPR